MEMRRDFLRKSQKIAAYAKPVEVKHQTGRAKATIFNS